MDDKMLLELAAKAAGYVYERFENETGCYNGIQLSEPSDEFPNGLFGDWNPLINDDDALRLAVKLRLGVNILETEVRVLTPMGAQCIVEVLYNGECPYSKTRRAIVHAAAEIGRCL